MSVSSYFSGTYAEAREKFLAAAADQSLEVESLLNQNAKGAEGEDLYSDIVRIGPAGASRVLVLSSATHGVEGYCGSGPQIGLLREGRFNDLPDDLSVVMIHAMNPYGFSHNRRVTEDNVDLNRNFVDFDNLPDTGTAYAGVHPLILPDDWDGPAKQAADEAIEIYIAEHGLMAFQAAVSGGQYSHANGVFYGGTGPTWSNKMVRSVLTKHAGQASRLGVIDFHTGLGPYGYGEMITDGPPADKARASEWYGEQATNPDAGTSTSAPLKGTFGLGVADTLPHAELAFIALEYGTYDITRILNAVRGDNWLYQKGELDSEVGRAIKQEIRDAFYPDKDDWKQAVWTRALEAIDLAMAGLTRDA